jgi:hypothetical protein
MRIQDGVRWAFALVVATCLACGGQAIGSPEPGGGGGSGGSGGGGSAGAGGSGGSGGGGGVPTCGAIEIIPPVITVKTWSDSSECDPKFRVVEGGGASLADLSATRCPSNVAGCPADATEQSCTFVLFGMGLNTVGTDDPITVQVTESGFEPGIIKGVATGSGGCVSGPPATNSVVTLGPLPLDAGAD